MAVEEITADKLKDVPYELLAQELCKRMLDMGIREIHHLRDDAEYSEKLKSLQETYEEVGFILDEVKGRL